MLPLVSGVASYPVWTSSLWWAASSGIWGKVPRGPWCSPAVSRQCWTLLLVLRCSIQVRSIRAGAARRRSEETRCLTSERRTGVWDGGGPNKAGGKLLIAPAAGPTENLGWNPGSASWPTCHTRHKKQSVQQRWGTPDHDINISEKVTDRWLNATILLSGWIFH